MGKPKLELVDQTFDVAFEAMRDRDMARKQAPLLTPADILAFVDGLDDVFDVTEADVIAG